MLQTIPINVARDGRGTLAAIEALPFEMKRVFVLNDLDPNGSRAEHAVSCDEFIVMLAGSCTLELRSLTETRHIRLEDRTMGLLVPAGIWMRLSDFSPGTCLLVACPTSYAETAYFQEPQI